MGEEKGSELFLSARCRRLTLKKTASFGTDSGELNYPLTRLGSICSTEPQYIAKGIRKTRHFPEKKAMNSRQRVIAALNHQQPDRVPVDFGATPVTGIHVSALTRLRRAVLGDPHWRVKVVEPFQMLGEIDPELRRALGLDVIPMSPRRTMFGFENINWKPFTMFDGTEVLVPGNFNYTVDANGDYLMYPEGDLSVPPSGRMPKGCPFFDAIVRQEPLDEDRLDPADNAEEFGLLSEDDLAWYHEKAKELDQHADMAVVLGVPGTAFGDIALVPAVWMKRPKGIRDVAEWYMSTAMRQDYVREVFEQQCQIALANLETLIGIFGDRVQAAFVTGTDFGTQRGLFISLKSYRELFKPFHKRVNDLIHAKTKWKTFIHSCGAVADLVPDLVEAGFDILNPVQCSAVGMDAQLLKDKFGAKITFWGGGSNTQQTLQFGTPDEVYREVSERIAIFNRGGGFVFNTVHNVQSPTPTENLLAMFRAIQDSGKV